MKKLFVAILVCLFLTACSSADDGDHKDPNDALRDWEYEDYDEYDEAQQEAADYYDQQQRGEEYDQMMEAAYSDHPDAISYDEAKKHIGEYVEIIATAYVDTESACGDPIFVDLGESYPSEDRVVGVIWPEHHSDFPDIEDCNFATIVMEGTLYEYDGIPNIELTDSFQIEKLD